MIGHESTSHHNTTMFWVVIFPKLFNSKSIEDFTDKGMFVHPYE